MQFAIHNSYLIPLLPLLGAVVAGFFGDLYLKGKAHLPIWIGVGCSAILSLIILSGMVWGSDPLRCDQPVDVYRWISAGSFTATAGFYFDPLTAIMLCIVTGIGLIITIFAAGYMKGEDGYSRFFAYLGLFIFSMTCLVMANNLVLMFLGWEGVGLCSYLLIGYYYWRPAAAAAAKKAFIVNRVGDFGFLVGIMLCFYAFGTVSFFGGSGGGVGKGILEMAHNAWIGSRNLPANAAMENQLWALQFIPFCLMIGAFGKSAQFPLYVWLPDAMEGPTPVSALIHAATMVTAGIYMIARCGTLFVSNSAALTVIAVIGAFTALFAATIALRQFDLKKVFAYSTISQLGYMFVAVGILAPTAAVFHLLTHAFFKALLFLSSGVVMHAMLGHLDLRKISGLKKVLPKTNLLMLAGCAALAGFPFVTSGFYSKDEIIGLTWDHSLILGAVLLFTAFLTSYYTWRVYFQVFQGPLLQPTTPADPDHTAVAPHAPDAHESHAAVDDAAAHHHNHEPWIMIGPLTILAIGAICIGWIVVRNGQLEHFLGQSKSFRLAYEMAKSRFDNTGPKVLPASFGQPEAPNMREPETILPWSMLQGAAVSIAGLALAWLLHLKQRARAEQIALGLAPLTRLLEGKYFIDELYDVAIVAPLRLLAKWFFEIDRVIVDSFVWAVGFIPQFSGFALKLTLQRGYLQGYAAAMMFGVLAILLLVFL